MNVLKPVLSLVIITLFCNCSGKEPIGSWDDNIRLSIKAASFKSNGDSLSIKTGGNWWWITDVSIDNHTVWQSISRQSDTAYYLVDLDSVKVERRDQNTLFVRANKNNLKASRQIRINLQAGDYFDYVTITQSGQ